MATAVHVQLDLLEQTIGLSALLKLVGRFGGRGMYVPNPKRLTENHPIVKAIGMDAARRFSGEWRGLDVMLPLGTQEMRDRRNRAIREDAKRMSISELAERHSLTMRSVSRIIAAAE